MRKPTSRQPQYTAVSNALFRDPRISYKAKGIFGFIATHEDGDGISVESIADAGTDGITAVRTGLQELESYGYLSRLRHRSEDGTLGPVEYVINDEPEGGVR